ncbi:hypothetical protein VNO78_23342 [Psophocarpus tetragonolobus]|uniref:Uncharacterized protein n=1 Tax=Psophocarpus tetragonolobus TaxID=3891 RepID=A0AAN9S6G9_PSOTE
MVKTKVGGNSTTWVQITTRKSNHSESNFLQGCGIIARGIGGVVLPIYPDRIVHRMCLVTQVRNEHLSFTTLGVKWYSSANGEMPEMQEEISIIAMRRVSDGFGPN